MKTNSFIRKIKNFENKKNKGNNSLMHISVFSKFFLADILFTFLPIIVVAIIRISLGKLDNSIFLISEWAFSSIILSSLALTRVLELKVQQQVDTSEKVMVLSRICIILIIFSVLNLSLYILKDQGYSVNEEFILVFQFSLIFSNIILLGMAHYVREKHNNDIKNYPKDISPEDFHYYSSKTLFEISKKLKNLNICFSKTYDFKRTKKNSKEEKLYSLYRKNNINVVIKEIEDDMNKLKKLNRKWKGAPYNKKVFPKTK